MKKIMMIAVLVVSSVTFAQNREPKLEEVNGLVKATYYHENGEIQQEGFFADGKLEVYEVPKLISIIIQSLNKCKIKKIDHVNIGYLIYFCHLVPPNKL